MVFYFKIFLKNKSPRILHPRANVFLCFCYLLGNFRGNDLGDDSVREFEVARLHWL